MDEPEALRRREELRRLTVETLAASDHVLAVMEGGGAAFGRVDRWSDVDLHAIVEDDTQDRVFDELAAALAETHPVERTYRVPEPTWHGFHQQYFSFTDLPPTLQVDLVLIQRSRRETERCTARHGVQPVLYDAEGLAATEEPDPAILAAKLRKRVPELVARQRMFRHLVAKSLARGHLPEATAWYHGLTLRPLTELLRLHHDPLRHDFGPRYVEVDLPEEVVARLTPLHFPTGVEDLLRCQAEACDWFDELADALDLDELVNGLVAGG